MGKAKNAWYQRAVQLIRLYPQLSARRDSLDGGRITASYNASHGHSAGASRKTENLVLQHLSPIDDMSLSIVQEAIDEILTKDYGELTMEVIRCVDWENDCTLEAIQMKLPISRMTAQRYRSRFIRLVAKKAGWNKKDETS